MTMYNDEFAGKQDSAPQDTATQPKAYRVDEDDTTEEKDLERTYLFGKGDDPSHPTEGLAAGGQNFGRQGQTPAGDDRNNPSQNAGYHNAYFARTEPSDEHPENSNFTAQDQNGAPGYDHAQTPISAGEPKPEKVERGDGENDRPHPQEAYVEGTDDNDGTGSVEPNIPGPNELPDQQKVGEDNAENK